MGIKELIQKMGEKNKERKEKFKSAQEDLRIQQMLEERQKSSNERELIKLQKEKREKLIKDELIIMRKNRDNDIKFNHNPLNTKNIMKAEWEVMKEPNQFSNTKCMFLNKERNVMKNNPNLLKNNRRLFGI